MNQKAYDKIGEVRKRVAEMGSENPCSVEVLPWLAADLARDLGQAQAMLLNQEIPSNRIALKLLSIFEDGGTLELTQGEVRALVRLLTKV